MNETLQRYNELREELRQYSQQPIGDRIKKGGNLENRIKEVFSKERADIILTRTDKYDFDRWEKINKECYKLKLELEEAGLITE